MSNARKFCIGYFLGETAVAIGIMLTRTVAQLENPIALFPAALVGVLAGSYAVAAFGK
jgi:hypothetical protein